jgi:hypothetical protein
MRYYAFELVGGRTARLLKMRDDPSILAEAPFAWSQESEYRMEFEVAGPLLRGRINGATVLECRDEDHPLNDGACGLTAVNGRLLVHDIEIRPVRTD